MNNFDFKTWLTTEKQEAPEEKIDYKSMYKNFNNWLFDGDLESEIPIGVVSSKSPITHHYVLSLFLKYPELHLYLNKHFNKWDVYRLDKIEFFQYIKEKILQFGVNQRNLMWLSHWKQKDKFLAAISKKAPYLKKCDLQLIKHKLNKPNFVEIKSSIEATLGLDKPSKSKVKKSNKVVKPIQKKLTIEDIKKSLVSSIKNKPGCQECKLKNEGYTLCDANFNTFDSPVDILWIGRDPGEQEVSSKRPFVGKAGAILRSHITEFGMEDLRYVIYNIVQCRPPGNKEPEQETISKCSYFLNKMIDIVKPKLIVSLGGPTAKWFGIEGSMKEIRGQVYDWKGHKVFCTYHPSSFNYGNDISLYKEDFANLRSFIFDDNKEEMQETKNDDLYLSYATANQKIRNELDKKSTYLLNVEHLWNKDKIAYIYIDQTTKEKKILLDSTYTYFYALNNDDDKITFTKPISEVRRVDCLSYYKLKEKTPYFPIQYESDIPVNVKRSSAYYRIKREIEEPYDLTYIVIDIECVTEDNSFPNPEEAPVPIVAVSILDSITGKTFTYVLKHNKDHNVQNTEFITYLDNEKSLLQAVQEKIIELNRDVITGWNVGFDLQTIVNRMQKNNLSPHKLSVIPGAKVNVDSSSYRFSIPGFIILDYMHLYKEVFGNKQESYKLDNVAFEELKEQKLKYEGTLYQLYTKEFEKFVQYNIKDVVLVHRLDDKLQYISLSNELRRLTGTTWDVSLTSSGLCDGLICEYLHNKDQVAASRNAISRGSKKELPGAYVMEPKMGLYDYVCDFDAASLYPSIIMSCNLSNETYYAKINNIDAKEYLYDKESFNNKEKIQITMDPLYNKSKNLVTPKEFDDMVEIDKLIVTITGAMFKRPDSDVGKGFLSEIMEDLITQRKVYKQKMLEAAGEGNEKLETYYNQRQMTYKILANSIYGFLTFEASRMYIYDLAEVITSTGQELVKVAAYMSDLKIQEMIKRENAI